MRYRSGVVGIALFLLGAAGVQGCSDCDEVNEDAQAFVNDHSSCSCGACPWVRCCSEAGGLLLILALATVGADPVRQRLTWLALAILFGQARLAYLSWLSDSESLTHVAPRPDERRRLIRFIFVLRKMGAQVFVGSQEGGCQRPQARRELRGSRDVLRRSESLLPA